MRILKTMTFDINAVVVGAITRGLSDYKNQLSAKPEQADKLKLQHASILKTIGESFGYDHIQEEAVQLLLELFPTFERWGYWSDCITISKEALSLDLSPEQQGYLNANLGRIYLLNRNFDDSLRHLNQSLALADKHQLKNLSGLTHHRLMNTYLLCEDHTTAKQHGLQALSYLSKEPSETLAAAYNSLGLASMGLNKLTEAENYFWDALAIWDCLKDYTHMARSYQNLGVLFFQQGNLEEAKKCFENALVTLGNTSSIVDRLKAMNGLGSVYHSLGDFATAENVFTDATAKWENELGDKIGWYHLRGSLTHNLGNTQLAKGNPVQARVTLERATTFWQQANDDLQKGNTVGTIAEAFMEDEEWEAAVVTYDDALALLEKFPDHPWARKLANDFQQARGECAERLNSPEEGE
ncbi:tetratricopeptide repeat protein [Candidatus Leptofilum sp.]|uniref:tetratricopeptide repeat protein n=1 Tax=Candidatus Leptofilum sp. TaxID=3241576 RepID=UPI003B5BAC4A